MLWWWVAGRAGAKISRNDFSRYRLKPALPTQHYKCKHCGIYFSSNYPDRAVWWSGSSRYAVSNFSRLGNVMETTSSLDVIMGIVAIAIVLGGLFLLLSGVSGIGRS